METQICVYLRNKICARHLALLYGNLIKYSIMNNSRTKRLPKIIVGQFLVGCLMVLLAISVLFFAQGYRFNIKNFQIVKTGVIFIASEPKEAVVHINGKAQKRNTPFSLNLDPGYYNAEVQKEGYHPWSSSFKIEPELVTDFKSVVLFKTDSEITNLTDQRKIDLLESPVDYLAVVHDEDILTYNDYEIWQNNKLVTRFSSPIQNATWYSDMEHIMYQKGNEVRIIEKSGNNDTLLVRLTSATSTKFVSNSRGDELYYMDENQYKMARIR